MYVYSLAHFPFMIVGVWVQASSQACYSVSAVRCDGQQHSVSRGRVSDWRSTHRGGHGAEPTPGSRAGGKAASEHRARQGLTRVPGMPRGGRIQAPSDSRHFLFQADLGEAL